MEVIWQSEIDPYACKVLAKHWPEVVNHGNIKEINWEEIERPDVICGGYPCQPFSTAGKRRGEEDPRHLWPWVRTAISELRPRYAILENVRGHLSMGGLSVIAELASIGYDAEWRVVSAASVGANHRRDRIIIVAYPSSKRRVDDGLGIFSSEGRLHALGVFGQGGANVADANCIRLEGQRAEQQATGTSRGCENTKQLVANTNSQGREGRSKLSQTISERRGLDKSSTSRRWSGVWEPEPDVGRVAHGVPRRVDRLRGLGNAVVPQVAEIIGRLVISAEQRREV
jgi:DNA (cytosine-5)-methyltransferase 1